MSTNYQLSSLQANTQYSVVVAASTRVGTGPFSLSVAFETGTTSECKINNFVICITGLLLTPDFYKICILLH